MIPLLEYIWLDYQSKRLNWNGKSLVNKHSSKRINIFWYYFSAARNAVLIALEQTIFQIPLYINGILSVFAIGRTKGSSSTLAILYASSVPLTSMIRSW